MVKIPVEKVLHASAFSTSVSDIVPSRRLSLATAERVFIFNVALA